MNDMRKNLLVPAALIFFVVLGFCLIVSGNPLPMYPHPETTYSGPISGSRVNLPWIICAFIINFFVDILIVYGGICLLEQYHLLQKHRFFEIPRRTLLGAICIISLVGLGLEWIIGGWIVGLLLALFFIFLSFVLVSKYLFIFDLKNSIRMGLFAVMINIIAWIFVFMV